MISNRFKKTVIKRLKTDYGVVCHGIEMTDQSTSHYRYSLSCSANRSLFSLTLLVANCPVDSPNHLYTFEVYSTKDCLGCIPDIEEKMKIDLVFEAIDDVREDFSYLTPTYEFRLEHVNVTLLQGQYFLGANYFEMKSIKNRFATISCIKIYNFDAHRHLTCAAVNIDDNKIFIRPWTIEKEINPTFFQHGILEVGGLDTFKANLAKSVFLFFNDTDDDYMQLDYTDMKRFLLVFKMGAI